MYDDLGVVVSKSLDVHYRFVMLDLQDCAQCCSVLSLVKREVLIPELLECAVVERYVLDYAVLATVEVWEIQAAALDVVERYIAETDKECVFSIFSDIDIYRATVDLLHLYIGECYVFHKSSLPSEVIGVSIDLFIWQEAGDCVRCVVHHDV